MPILQFPIKLKCSAEFRQELFECEYGRYEDAQCARDAGDTELIAENDYDLVFCDFGDRYKTRILINDVAELNETWYALASGTIGVLGFTVTANNLLNKLRDTMHEVGDVDVIKLWPRQDGY